LPWLCGAAKEGAAELAAVPDTLQLRIAGEAISRASLSSSGDGASRVQAKMLDLFAFVLAAEPEMEPVQAA
jgi:hypothetical protein